MIKPKPLKKGSKVAVIGPSGSIAGGSEKLDKGLEIFSGMGLEFEVYPGCKQMYGYLAGSDEVRLGDLHQAFADPEIDGIICSKGGFGTCRILPDVDYDLIRKNPKIFLGYSDITGLHSAFNKLCGFMSFHGPMIISASSDPPLDDFSIEQVRKALFGEYEGQVELPLGVKLRCLVPGKAKGMLTGGNLTLLDYTASTKYGVDAKDKILFIEDVNEEPYRIDGHLCALRMAGVLDECAGILIGDFRDCTSPEPERSLTTDQVFADHLAHLGKPVIAGLPAGHSVPTLTLPLGAEVTLDADNLTVEITG